MEPSSANTGNFSAGQSSRAKEVPKSKTVEDVHISPHRGKSKGGVQKKDAVSKSLLPDLEERDPKSTVIEVSDGELPHLSPSRTLKFHDSQNSENQSEQSLPKQSSSLKTEDTSGKQKRDAGSHCRSESAHDGLNVEAGSPLEVQIVEEVMEGVVEEVHPQMNNLSSQSKSGEVRTSTGHNVTLGKKQLPCALENTRKIGAANKEEGSKLKEKEKRLPMESTSARVLKKTYEKYFTLWRRRSEKNRRERILQALVMIKSSRRKKGLVCVWCCLLIIQSGYFCLCFIVGFSFVVFH
jgi:hypothetical protein